MSKHTQGPWTTGESGIIVFGKSDYIGGDEIPERVAICESSGLYHTGMYEYNLIKEAQANARLIAAAPEMYEAIKWAVDNLTREDDRLPTATEWVVKKKLQAILTKIEGV
jgi:hypothetical protein